jgi:hypothetical protein
MSAVLSNRKPKPKQALRADHRYSAGEVATRGARCLEAADLDGARGGSEQAGQQAQQRSLARTVRADHGQHAGFGNHQVDTDQRTRRSRVAESRATHDDGRARLVAALRRPLGAEPGLPLVAHRSRPRVVSRLNR